MQLLTVILLGLPRLKDDKQAQDLIEYALLASFMALVVAAVIPNTAQTICAIFSQVASQLSGVVSFGSSSRGASSGM
jgi:Flp pilus assembly pilin Flp